MFDVVIIGGGIVGSAVAYELSKFKLEVQVLEKETELSCGASKANSGIVHAGHDCTPRSLKARLNLEGSKMFGKLCSELQIPYKQNGSLVLAFSENELSLLEMVYEKGVQNGVEGISIIKKEQVLNLEKNLSQNITAAVYSPLGAIISPYEATLAFAENAYANGVKFSHETEVTHIEKLENKNAESDTCYKIKTNRGEFLTKTVVNAAGLFADVMSNFVSEKKYEVYPRKGEYMLFDKASAGFINATVFQVPTPMGKGVLVTPTTHNNLIFGPSAEDTEDKLDKSTHGETLEKIMETAKKSLNAFPQGGIITSFVGLRACVKGSDDFIIEQPEDAKGFVNAIGINSPGLSSAPAIAKMITGMIAEILQPEENKGFIKERRAITIFRELSLDEQNNLIRKNNSYGKIVCRCETVTEGEILEAIRRPLGATTVDGVKRRTRAGMGRCQGGFCSSKVMEILAAEHSTSIEEITKFGGNSKIIAKG